MIEEFYIFCGCMLVFNVSWIAINVAGIRRILEKEE